MTRNSFSTDRTAEALANLGWGSLSDIEAHLLATDDKFYDAVMRRVSELKGTRPTVKQARPSHPSEALTQEAPTQVNEQRQVSSSIVCLDIIDIALYQALLQHPDLLKTLSWRVFERLLADILSTFGYEIELQRGTKDGGIDIFALRRDEPLGAHRYLLQAKRWSNRVGVEPVRQLLFLHSYHRATKSCLATTAMFSRGAWALAQQYQWQLTLRDYEGIHDWIRRALKIKQHKG